jgi:hypothetical protein
MILLISRTRISYRFSDEVECYLYVQMLFLLSRNSELLGNDVHFKYFPICNPQLIISDNFPNHVGENLLSLVWLVVWPFYIGSRKFFIYARSLDFPLSNGMWTIIDQTRFHREISGLRSMSPSVVIRIRFPNKDAPAK